jgi:hypothetical protein
VSDEQRTKALAAMTAIHRAAGEDSDTVAELELDAVSAVLSGSDLDADQLAAEVMDSVEPTARAVDAVVAVEVAAAEPTKSPRPRRRRAASRPAGPPSAE